MHPPPPSTPTTRAALLPLLTATGPTLRQLYARADATRRAHFGDTVPIRAIIEFSNLCANNCLYCGIRADNPRATRYRMTTAEILDAVRQVVATHTAGTIVLQSGETPGHGDRHLTDLIRQIKTEHPHLAITLSVGSRPKRTYAQWRDAGLDRFLLRFETSHPTLFARLHPGETLDQRLTSLRHLRELGIQTGGGFLIGLPGETLEILADNILLCQQHNFDMIGIGPFIPHPHTPLANQANAWAHDPDMFFRTIAALRLACPRAHIPATTAYDALFPDGRNRALQCGANVFMPNATPPAHRQKYQLYPGKPDPTTDPTQWAQATHQRLHTLGRPPDPGPAHSLIHPPRSSTP
ncbi:MAG: [FeFe] hydrogenase H-cluster radical SAM maturase HydE [Lentisphaerae bacterium]|nr:[FeFe] hydrogenase H-cluster radical SAM maturase HydE [Lentisphaerota bacterium]